jgi:Tfp pilus assembly protein PilF
MGQRLAFRTRASAVLSAVLLAASAAPAATDAGASDALQRAHNLLAAERLYPAEQAAREAIERAPERAEAHRLLGQILLRRKKPELAVASFERAAALAPEDTEIDHELGVARFEARDFAGAREPLRRALERNPDDTVARLQLGRCELELGDAEQAAREFERAAADPDYRQVALYNLGVARERSGARDSAREAFESALALDRSANALSDRAWAHIQALERTEEERPWQLGFGAGLLYDSNVRREEIDSQTGNADGAGRFELEGSYALPVWDWFKLEAGYDFDQTLYFDNSDFDLQSHTFHASAERSIGQTDASLGYLYSLNTLGGDRFLDFHDIHPALGIAPAQWWYASFSPALRVKRYEQEPGRDAEQGALGLLQLFALGNWQRHLLLGIDGVIENADDRAFDYRGFTTQAGVQLPLWLLGEEPQLLQLRYCFGYRDYTNSSSSPTGHRRDRIHSARARIELPIVSHVKVRAEYEFEDAASEVRSADYTEHKAELLLRFDL